MKSNKDRVVYTESGRMLNPPKGYKKSVTNKPDKKKVDEYFKGKKNRK